MSFVRGLLAVVVVLLSAGLASAADKNPQPPCGTPPVPAYGAVDAAPAVLVISGPDLAAWKPPSCVGWSAQGDGVLVALAGRFAYKGSADDLLKRFGAISTLKGLKYWSVTEGGWRTLITRRPRSKAPTSTVLAQTSLSPRRAAAPHSISRKAKIAPAATSSTACACGTSHQIASWSPSTM